jgi:hypothetical protein
MRGIAGLLKEVFSAAKNTMVPPVLQFLKPLPILSEIIDFCEISHGRPCEVKQNVPQIVQLRGIVIALFSRVSILGVCE